MKKVIVLALSTGLLVLGLGVGASSADAACSTKCLNKKINNLQGQVGSLNGQVQSLSGQVQGLNGQVGTLNGQVQSLNGQVGTLNGVIDCIRTAPVTSYYGYQYTNVTSFLTSALDFTVSGDPVHAWMLALQPGTCGTPTTNAAGASRAAGGFQPWLPAEPPEKKH